MNKSHFTALFVAAVSASNLALAQEKTVSELLNSTAIPSNVSTVNENIENKKSVMDNLYADLFANVHGPVLGDPNSPWSVNNKGQVVKSAAGHAVYADSELTTAYLLDKDSGIGIGPDVPFWYSPMLGQGMTLGDVGVKAFNKKAIDTGNLRVYANVYFQLPTNSYDRDVRKMNYGVKTTPYWWYHFQGTRWTVGSWNEAKTYPGAQDYTFKLYAEPYVNYRVSPKVALNLGYEMEAHHMTTSTSTLDFTNYQTDMQPGIVWNVSQTVMVNPYVQLFTGNKVTGDSTAVCAIVTARLL